VSWVVLPLIAAHATVVATLLLSELLSTSLLGNRSLARCYCAPLGTLASFTDSVIDKVIIEFVSNLSTSARADSSLDARVEYQRRVIVL
jgi:hypothetical protein